MSASLAPNGTARLETHSHSKRRVFFYSDSRVRREPSDTSDGSDFISILT